MRRMLKQAPKEASIEWDIKRCKCDDDANYSLRCINLKVNIKKNAVDQQASPSFMPCLLVGVDYKHVRGCSAGAETAATDERPPRCFFCLNGAQRAQRAQQSAVSRSIVAFRMVGAPGRRRPYHYIIFCMLDSRTPHYMPAAG